MGILDTLTQSPQSPGATSTSVSQQALPGWYTAFLESMNTRGANIAAQPYTPYDGARVAGFSPLQQAGFGAVQGAANSFQPMLDQAAGMAGAIPGIPGQYATGALTALSGAPSPWSSAMRDQYMSPYTSGVVDEIGRLGNRNLTENIMPSVNGAFIGSGQFGSSRNAEILGRSMRDAQRDITGQQQQALESGYNTAGGLFNQDQNRLLQQRQALSGANLNAGNLALSAGTQGAGALGQLAQLQQQLGLGGANAMIGAGGLQQAQQQRGLDTAYGDFKESQGFDLAQLNNLKSLMSGMQLPASGMSASSAPGGYGASPLEWITAILNGR
jgi:hypothetical protein